MSKEKIEYVCDCGYKGIKSEFKYRQDPPDELDDSPMGLCPDCINYKHLEDFRMGE